MQRVKYTLELFVTQLLLTTCEYRKKTRGHVTYVSQWQSVYNLHQHGRRLLTLNSTVENSYVKIWLQERFDCASVWKNVEFMNIYRRDKVPEVIIKYR